MSRPQQINELLRERVVELARYLFPNGHREASHWCVGSIDGEPGRSFKICIAGAKAGLSGDFGASEKHSRSLIDLWMHARKVDFKTALRQAADWLGESLNQSNGVARPGSKTGSRSTFRTLDEVIANTERRLKMRATRRDLYHDRHGDEHFVVVRFDSGAEKQFRPFCRNALGWVMSDPPGKLPLFRLPELLARSSERVFIVEGEKCACKLGTLGWLVTTSAHGAKSANKTDWQPLAGRAIVILPDNDEGGRAYAESVARILGRLSPPVEVRIIGLPGLPAKGDCVDWLDACDARTPEEIKAELLAILKSAHQIAPLVRADDHNYDVVEDDEEKPAQKSAATRLVDFANDFTFFYDPQDRPFVRLEINAHSEVWPVESSKFRKLLAGMYYKRTGKAINRNALADAITTLAGRACHESPEEPVFLRVAPCGENILIDLCDSQWRVVEVSPNDWQVLDKSPVAFVRTAAMQSLPEPVRSGSIDPLWDLLNVTPSQRPLVAGGLLNYLHPRGPYFVTNFVGEQGTAKTCAARIVRQLVDPNENPLRSPPKEERDLLAQAANNWCVALDNLSSLPTCLSDALCRLATGGGHSARSLYTDLDEISLAIKRPVILNGIEDVASRPDLAERVLQIELETIPDHKRISERELWREFDKQRPVIFSGLLDALVCALRELPNVILDSLPRMADAALWATAGETAFGWKGGAFIEAYKKNLNEGAIASVEAHPVGVVIRQLLDKQNDWSGEPTQLLQSLNNIATEETRRAKTWPQNARSLSACLRRLAQALRRAGIAYETAKGQRRTVRLCKAGNFASQSSFASQNETQGDGGDAKDANFPLLHDPLITEALAL